MIYAKLFFFFFVCCSPLFLFSQSDSISGIVVNENNLPLQRASVFIPNSTIGVYTNEIGRFALSKLSVGNSSFVVSYVGYETQTVTVLDSLGKKNYLVRLHPVNNIIKTIITSKQNNNWKKWIDLFNQAFVGSSSYAKHCIIENKDVIRFYYSEENKLLRAFANEPLSVINIDLGYEIKVSLIDFSYNTTTNVVDYQVYSFFKEMSGSDKQKAEWKKNRKKVYSYSLLRFMRSAYLDNFDNDGYRVAWFNRKISEEAERIQKLYRYKFEHIKDSLSRINTKENDINSLIENSFSRDSLAYYKRTLNLIENGDNDKLKTFTKDSGFLKRTNNNTMRLDFTGNLKVTYTRTKEPEEYYEFKNEAPQFETVGGVTFQINNTRSYPTTTLVLRQGIPIEINENGYYTNVDFFMDGFWGWWEKMATKLPYEYQP